MDLHILLNNSKLNHTIIFIFIIFNASVSQDCSSKHFDSAHCYLFKKYIRAELTLEQKWKNTDTTLVAQIPLIADLDNDCIPEFMVRGFSKYIPGISIDTPRVHLIDGRNGTLKNKFDVLGFEDANVTALLIDMNNDGIDEIIVSKRGGFPPYSNRLLCYDIYGALVWFSDDFYFNSSYDPGGENLGAADFNQDGIPEVYTNNRIFNAQTGNLLIDGGAWGVGSNFTMNAGTHQVSVAAQLDDDPQDLELAAGYSIYKVKIINRNGRMGNSMTPVNILVDGKYLDGKTAIADINLDGRLDVIVSYGDFNLNSRLYTYSLFNGIPTLLTKNSIRGTDSPNSCPSIGDVDGNGIPNILVSKTNSIHNFEYDGTGTLKLIWSLSVTDTVSYTGITTFDLNGDGKNEIIYRGDSLLYLIDGSVIPPQILDSKTCYSITLHENPIVADIDNSGSSKICVICGTHNS